MPGDEELVRTLRKLVVDHAETRWLALRLDYDVKDLRADVKVVRSDVKELRSEVGELREGQDAMRGELSELRAEQTVMRAEQTEMRAEQTEMHNTLVEHSARFDSLEGQMRSLTQMVGEVLTRMPEKPATTDGNP